MAAPPELAVVFPRAGSTGGVERVAQQFLRFEAARRSTAFVGTELDGADVRFERVAPGRVPAAAAPIAFRRAARRALAELRPATTVSLGVECPPGDVLWVHSVHAAWLADGGDLVIRGRRVPASIRRLLPRHQVLLQLERAYFTGSRPRAVVCTSAREADDIHRLYGVARDIVHVVPNGYDGAEFSPGRRAELRAAGRSRIGATDGETVVLVVANEWHRKGLGVLLHAVAATADPRLRVELVGARAPRDHLQLADRLGLADRVAWHGPSGDVASWYAAADVFALPTTYEPFGLVILEAMAMGVPVITSAAAGAAEAIVDATSGLLLREPRDPAEVTAALTRLADSDERDRIGMAAAVAARRYEWDHVLSRVDAIVSG